MPAGPPMPPPPPLPGPAQSGDAVEELARRSAAGDSRALDQLLAAVRPDVMRRCRRILDDPADAEEACQDALMSVSRRIATFSGDSKFSTWLYAVASNAAIDTYRRRHRRRLEEMSVDSPGIDVGRGGASSMAANRVDLLNALAEIQAMYAQPVVLRDFQGLDYAEIAETLGLALGTVKSRIHEGRRQVRERMTR